MKRCLRCSRVELDDSLSFCRIDGAGLISVKGADGPTGNGTFENETRILPSSTDSTAVSPTRIIATPAVTNAAISSNKGKLYKTLAVVVACLITIAISLLGYAYLSHTSLSNTSRTPIDSVAVLPFQNASGDPNSDYLSDGISEALINSLTELQQLKVVARTTAFSYKGKNIDPRQVGRELNVQSVLTGRVRQVGENLDVQVDLIDVATGSQLWGHEYERRVSEALWVKQAIAEEVKQKLKLQITGDEQRQLVKHDTSNAEAYQFYLRGRYFLNRRSAEGLRKALDEFQQAIDRDPSFALGYVGLADSYILQGQNAGVSTRESIPKARVAADRALQIDDSLAEAHTSSAMIYQKQWRWSDAEAEYKKAITLNPKYSTAHQWYSNYLFTTGRLEEALAEGKQAQELDPLSPIIGHNLAYVYLLLNNLDQAIAESHKVLEVSPNYTIALSDLGWVYLKKGQYEEATRWFEKSSESAARASNALANLGYCYAVTGRRTEALEILKELEQRREKGEAIAFSVATVYAGLGEKNNAFELLEEEFQEQSGQLSNIAFWPSLESLRSDQRYKNLVQRMGLKP